MADTPRVTVPVEPTEAMKIAGVHAIDNVQPNDVSRWVTACWSAMLSAAPAPEGGAVDGPEDDELPGDFLARVGMDGALWADGFRKMALKLGYSDMDEGWLIGWFCNAVMAGYDHAQRRFDPALATREEAPAPCKSCNGSGMDAGSRFNRCPDCSEEAPAEAGDPRYFAAFMAEDNTLRVQPQARGEAQPVAWRWKAPIPHVGDGTRWGWSFASHPSTPPPSVNPQPLYATPPAPEAEKLRVAVEALTIIGDVKTAAPVSTARQALATLQQEDRPDA